MSMNNFDPIANRLGYTREQMIAKHGERGTKPLSEIAEAEGLKLSELTQDTYSGQKTSGYNPSDIFGEGFDNNNNDLAGLLKMLGQLVERLFKLLGADKKEDNDKSNEENTTQKVKDSANDFSYIWDGESEEEAINIFTSGSENIFLDDNGSIPVSELTADSKKVSGKKTTSKKTSSKKTSSKKTSSKKTSSKKTSSKKTSGNSNNAENKKIKTVANKTGYDKKTVSAVVKAAATGQYTGKPESVVPKMAMDLGLPQEAVANILKELNNGSI